MVCQQASAQQKKQPKSYTSYHKLYAHGLNQEKSNLLDQVNGAHIDTIMSPVSSKNEESLQITPYVEKSAIAESQLEHKNQTLIGKKDISELDIQITNSLQILEVALTSRGKVLKPFWNIHIMEKSRNLWLPTETDCVDLDSTYSNILSKNFPMVKLQSFDVEMSQKLRSSSMISYQSLRSFLPESTDCVNMVKIYRPNSDPLRTKQLRKIEKKKWKKVSRHRTTQKKKNCVPLRTMKIKLKLSSSQIKFFNRMFGVYRWFYNESIIRSKEFHIASGLLRQATHTFEVLKNLMRDNDLSSSSKRKKTYSLPIKWKNCNLPHRIIDGAIQDFCSAFSSAKTLHNHGKNKHFEIHRKRKKDKSQILHLYKDCFGKHKGDKVNRWADTLFPRSLDKLQGFYKIKHKRVSLSEIPVKLDDCKILYQNCNFFLLIPYEKEEKIIMDKPLAIISLDSGVRTFQTGYSPSGHVVEILKNETDELKKYYRKLDNFNAIYYNTRVNGKFTKDKQRERIQVSKKRKRIYEKIKNKIDDYHWKIISYLTSNYSDIVMSDFQVKQLLGRKELKHITKRVLTDLAHNRFRQHLIEKACQRGVYLYLIDESYTSKTCGKCGILNQFLGANKTFHCNCCGYVCDRDVNASRNILLKFIEIIHSHPCATSGL